MILDTEKLNQEQEENYAQWFPGADTIAPSVSLISSDKFPAGEGESGYIIALRYDHDFVKAVQNISEAVSTQVTILPYGRTEDNVHTTCFVIRKDTVDGFIPDDHYLETLQNSVAEVIGTNSKTQLIPTVKFSDPLWNASTVVAPGVSSDGKFWKLSQDIANAVDEELAFPKITHVTAARFLESRTPPIKLPQIICTQRIQTQVQAAGILVGTFQMDRNGFRFKDEVEFKLAS